MKVQKAEMYSRIHIVLYVVVTLKNIGQKLNLQEN